MTANYTHPQFLETELEILKNEFNQKITINEKYNFWKDKFKVNYAFWGRILINGYANNFEIIPTGIEETQTLIKLILEDAIPVFWKRNDLRINDMKEQFEKQIKSAPNKLVVVDYEIKKIDDLVLPKRQTNMYEDSDKYEKDLYFVRGFENYLIYKKEFESYEHILAGYLLVEYYKGIQLAKYQEFVKNHIKTTKKDLEVQLNGEQKVLALHYLGLGSDIDNSTIKAKLYNSFIPELNQETIRGLFSRISDHYKKEQNKDKLLDYFRSINLRSKSRLLEDKIDNMK